MIMKATHWTQHWHHISATSRLLIIALAGIGAFFLLSSESSLTISIALSWALAGGLYLALTYIMMFFSNEANILALSKKEDDGAAVILLIIILAAAASLITIVIILSGIKALPIDIAIRHVLLVLGTYVISWFFVHTAFALHYAHIYYQEYEKTSEAPLLFSSKLKPSYIDFLYFSMVIGMTCQTADVNIAECEMEEFIKKIQGE